MKQGVVHEVGYQAFDQDRVARDGSFGDLRVETDALALGVLAARQDRLLRDGREVEAFPTFDPSLAPRQGEQRRDQTLLQLTQPQKLLARRAPRLDTCIGVCESHLQQAPLGGERSAQLVRGVGRETSLRFERRFQASEQIVEGLRELFELVVGTLEIEALVQAGGGDSPEPSPSCGAGV